MQYHYLSKEILDAKRLTPSEVLSKVKSGWVWYRLSPGFCSTGATAHYSRAMVSPEGVVVMVSDRAAGMDALNTLPVMTIDHRMIRLVVPFAEKDLAKSLGAVWIGHKKTWACPPFHRETFSRWITEASEEFDVLEC